MSKSNRAAQPQHAIDKAIEEVAAHHLLGRLAREIDIRRRSRLGCSGQCDPAAYAEVRGQASLVLNDEFKLSPAQWSAIIALALLALGVGAHRRLPVPDPLTDMAAQLAALHWWHHIKVGELPANMELPHEWQHVGHLPLQDLVQRLRDDIESEPALLQGRWTINRNTQRPFLQPGASSYRWLPAGQKAKNFEELFAQALVDNAKRALQLQHSDSQAQARPGHNPNSVAQRAKRWLVTHYPLLGALLVQFDLVEDADLCRRLGISIAAIHIGTAEIYINPLRALNFEQCQFVLAHEALHAGLNHASRRQGRDPYLWNVACDFVINDWLVHMGVGVAPDSGLLYDDELRGWAAEDIYLRLAADLRVRRRLCTLRGQDVDMLDDRHDRFFTDREAFYRQSLLQGLDFHLAGNRGTLPAGLEEAIRTLNQPPIPWQAELATWIQEHFPLPERRRSYARPSRRQSATPDTPRPRFVEPVDERSTHTFGVILDTSGSMSREDLGKALGAVVSYAMAQNVKQVRLIYCDATPYDEGYVDIQTLASRVRVRGRGGTVLQPAVQWLQTRADFPRQCPILIITDGGCEHDLQVKNDHAFLMSPGTRLPFVTRQPVFTMR